MAVKGSLHTKFLDITADMLYSAQRQVKDVRCAHCGKLLGKFLVVQGEVKCPRCGLHNVMDLTGE